MPRTQPRLAVLAIAVAALIGSALPCAADTIVLKGGSMVIGTYHGGGADEIRMTADEKSPAYPRKNVITLIIGTGRVKSRIEPMIADKDTLELTDGTLVEGRYAGGNSEEVRFEIDGELQTYPVTRARRLTIGHPDLSKPASETP